MRLPHKLGDIRPIIMVKMSDKNKIKNVKTIAVHMSKCRKYRIRKRSDTARLLARTAADDIIAWQCVFIQRTLQTVI